MTYKKQVERKRTSAAVKKALAVKKVHDKQLKGKKTKLIPHPTVPKTFIEVIIDD